MKATIIRPDGTRIEAEGTPEELAQLAGGSPNAACNSWLNAATCPRFIRPLQPFPALPVSPMVPLMPPAGTFYVGDVVSVTPLRAGLMEPKPLAWTPDGAGPMR